MPATAVLARVRLVALAVVLAIGTGEVGALGRLFLPAADGVRTLIEQVVGRIG